MDVGPALAAEHEVDDHLGSRGDFHQLLLALLPLHLIEELMERWRGQQAWRAWEEEED